MHKATTTILTRVSALTVVAVLLASAAPALASGTPIVHVAIASPANNANLTRGAAISFQDGSVATGCSITGWNWTFGDGGTSTLQNPSYTYNTSDALGAENVTLTVTAPACNGGLDTSITIHLVNVPPTASLSAPATIAAGTPATLDASGSTDADGTITTYTFSVDGVAQASQATATLAHTFTTVGTHNVSVAVTDSDGATASTARQNITVGPGPLTTLAVSAYNGTASIEAGSSLQFFANGTDTYGNIAPVSAAWSSSCGAIDATGLLASGNVTGVCTVNATSDNVTGGTTVTIVDTTAPVFSVPANMTFEADGPNGTIVAFSIIDATDYVDGTVPVVCSPASNATFPLGNNTVACTATDSSGNVGHGSFGIRIVDTTPPVLSNPGNLTVEGTDSTGANVTFTIYANDTVDGTDAVSCNHASGTHFAFGTTNVTCQARDHANNSAHTAFSVTVQDTTGPVILLPADIVKEATSAAGARVFYNVTASDAVDGARPVSCAPSSNTTFALGTTLVTCTSKDKKNNTSTGSFNVTVQDTTAPTLHIPSGIVAEAASANGTSVNFNSSATDAVDGTDAITCDASSGDVFPIATTTVTCTSTDSHNNTATGAFNVTVQDTKAPVLTLPGNFSAGAADPSGAVVQYLATANDAVDGSVAVSCSPASNTVFPLGQTVVTCTATDAHGNLASGSFTVSVVNTSVPTIHVPGNLVREATSAAGAVVTFTVTANDTNDGTLTPTCTPASNTTFALGNTTVTCTVTNSLAYTATGTFTVTVRDTTAPTITVPPTITAPAAGLTGTNVLYTTSATDKVDGTDSVTCDKPSGMLFPIGSTTVTCTSIDAHNNKATATFRVLVTASIAQTVVSLQPSYSFVSTVSTFIGPPLASGQGIQLWTYSNFSWGQGVGNSPVSVTVRNTQCSLAQCVLVFTGTTDANGVFAFTINDPKAMAPGTYAVQSITTYTPLNIHGVAGTTYTVDTP